MDFELSFAPERCRQTEPASDAQKTPRVYDLNKAQSRFDTLYLSLQRVACGAVDAIPLTRACTHRG